MNVTDAIHARRSIKAYDPAHKMSEAEVKKLISLAMLAPTAFNIQHWRFVSVEDAALRAEIQAVSWNQAQVTEASLLLVLVADVQGAAAQAGIRRGDVVLGLNNAEVQSLEQFNKQLTAVPAEKTIALLIQRGENTLYVPIKLAAGK